MERGNNEPKLTETNSETVLAEEELVDDDREGRSGDEAPAADATGTRTGLGAIPSSFGASGGTTPK
jgi:hypothetical protein